jgi:SSS family solute:Na+ symporter
MVNILSLAVVSIYFIAIIGIGIWSRKWAVNRDNFFVAGRRGTTLFITGSLLATIIGGSSTVGLAGLAFKQGLTAMWWLLAGCIGLLIMGLFFAKKVRKFAVYTLPELVEKQYDKNVGFAASILIVVAWAGVVAAQIVAAGKVLSIIGGSLDHWMFVFTIVFVAYAVLGGQHSIIRTDVLQSAILLFGIFASLFVTLSIIGGFNGLKSLPPDFFSFPVSTNFGFKSLLSFLIIVGATYVVGPDIYTRLFCADNERTAQNSTLITAFLIMFLSIAIALIGMSAKLLYPEIAPEQAFPQIIQQTLPFWLGSMVMPL